MKQSFKDCPDIKDCQMKLANFGGKLIQSVTNYENLKHAYTPLIEALSRCEFDDVDLGGVIEPAYRETLKRLRKIK